ncbi:MAG: peptidyl-prolyl cis-trans isomerase [Phaeodactylibacter sp.]|nr:peptidyl-prolyl cis-trans isomerase [Phaeodactylibacter sp.]MCB9299482.1 peptidyl-prolyl cis-trans isomerase [Lewinellaceae bacterium]HQU58283.1 peptidylprolyl isomerase [Saprospiraceae bacterium]
MAIFLAVALCGLLLACSSGAGKEKEDRLLAKVHNKSLFLSELDGMFPEKATSEDSSAIIQAYIQRWVRDAIILYEAERNIPGDLNLDKLVRDYRASLIRHNYEKVLIEEFMDSTVSQDELEAFYELNKAQYQLETPIVRCFFIKVSQPVPEAEELRRLWNSKKEEDLEKLVAYCNAYAQAHLLDEDTWYNLDNIAMEMPPGSLTPDNVESRRDFSQRDDDFQYYLRVFEVKNRKEIAPLAYVEEQARRIILRSRQEKFLRQKVEEMYDIELRRNNIQTYY